MPEAAVVHPSRQIRRFSSHEEQEAETIRYWNQRSIEEKMRGTAELIEYAYRQRGIDVHAQRPDRSLVRVQCPWG
jgi:hypothetical protein